MKQLIKIKLYGMDKIELNELMNLAEVYVEPVIDAVYSRLMDLDFALEDPEVIM